MKKQHVFSILLGAILILAGAVIAGSGRTDETAITPPPIGAEIEDFSLLGVDGATHSLKSLKERRGADFHFSAMPGIQCLQPAHGKAGQRLQSARH
jgi:hypothetical protein